MSHHYQEEDKEFVFAFRGQPFATTISSNNPTPTTLIDFSLVRDLKMKMTDLKCKRFTYANQKMRILGQITHFVQYVKDGAPMGQCKFSATVVRGLTQALDVDSIAGTKLVSKLTGTSDQPASADDKASPTNKRAKVSPKKDVTKATSVPASVPGIQPVDPPPGVAAVPTVPAAASNTPLAPSMLPRASPPAPRTPPRASPPAAARSPSSSPGSPTTSPSTEASIPVRRVRHGKPLSPYSANIMALSEAFADADLHRDENEQIWALEEVDEDGYLGENGYGGECTYTLTNGLQYSVNHGRHGCSLKKCPQSNFSKKPMFHNCGYHSQWALPDDFKPCGDRCMAAFCPCLRLYHRGGRK